MCIFNFPSALGLNEFTHNKRPFTAVFFDSVQNGPLRILKKGSKPKMGSKSKKDTIEKNLSNNDTNENEGVSCGSKTEETCYDKWYKPVSCSLMSEGRMDVSDTARTCAAIGQKMSTPAMRLGNPTRGFAGQLKMAALVLKDRLSASRVKASAAMLVATKP